MTEDRDLTIAWEYRLTDLLEEDGEEDVETFERAGLLTYDRGIVIYKDGQEIHITIQAYSK